jgi:hypothetical protein
MKWQFCVPVYKNCYILSNDSKLKNVQNSREFASEGLHV